MNTKLRTDLLTSLWLRAHAGWPEGGVSAQRLLGIPETSPVEDVYLNIMDKFLTEAVPLYTKTIDDKVYYEFPPEQECIRHLLYNVLLKNRPTFLRFIINTYCTEDDEAAMGGKDLWAFIVQWARKYDIELAYLPVTQKSLLPELEDLGYTRVMADKNSGGIWGLRIADNE